MSVLLGALLGAGTAAIMVVAGIAAHIRNRDNEFREEPGCRY